MKWHSVQLQGRSPIRPDPGCRASLSLIASWLSECLSKHEWCLKVSTTSTPFVPDRLLYIAPGSNIRLSTDHLPNVSYLALSYCWGLPTIFSTTTENIRAHQENISWSSLPRTFQQAIDVTRFLGYEYIWIDSLCIIQHDPDDFAQQSGQMGDIYAHATAVISADAAQNVNTGFLHRRERPTTIIKVPKRKLVQKSLESGVDNRDGLITTNLENPTSDESNIFLARPYKKTWILSSEHEEHDTSLFSPTNSRAWWYVSISKLSLCPPLTFYSFQEQHLARRIIHFSHSALTWQCGTTNACECGKPYTGSPSYNVPPALLSQFQKWSLTPAKSFFDLDAHEFWLHAVAKFAARKLTIPTDRLPAIAGLASRIACDEMGEYYAGLWGKDLPRSLLWSCCPGGWSVREPYIGPTWSWVAVVGAKLEWGYMLGDRLERLAEVVGIQKYLQTPDPFGAVDAAWIQIRGMTQKCEVRPESDWESGVRIHVEKKMVILDPKPPIFRTQGSVNVHGSVEVVLLLLAKPTKYQEWHGLVLVNSRKQEGAFERIGYFKTKCLRGRKWKRKMVTII